MSGFGKLFGSWKRNKSETYPVDPPKPLPTPPTSNETFSIYYAWPSTKRKPWGSTIVLADEMRFPNHPEYALGVELAKTHKVFGYVPLGTEDNPTCLVSIHDNGDLKEAVKRLSRDQFAKAVGEWKGQGAYGIFVDTYGFDYENSRGDQLWANAAIAGLGLAAILNAWNPEDVPWSILPEDFHFLFESPQEDLDVTERRMAYWKANAPKGARSYCVTTGEMNASDKARLEFLMAKYGVSGCQYRPHGHFTREDW